MQHQNQQAPPRISGIVRRAFKISRRRSKPTNNNTTMTATITTSEVHLHPRKEGRREHGSVNAPAEVNKPVKNSLADDSKARLSAGIPFSVETTLTFDAVQYWAKVDPDRTALIYADKQWKVDHGTLTEPVSHTTSRSNSETLVTDPSQWKTITYKEFYDKMNRFRAALHQAGVPLPSVVARKSKPYRILLLYAPTSRADVLALLMALQATGSVLLFGTPEAFGGLRNFIQTMLSLEPDAVLANRVVYTVFRSIAMTISCSKIKKMKKPIWFKSSILSKIVPKLTDDQIVQHTTAPASAPGENKEGVTLDSVCTIMFSSGTTGPPTPIEVTQRMLCFQAAGYAKLLQQRFGPGIIKDNSNISGSIDGDLYSESSSDHLTVTSQRQGPWISTHVFVNFVMLDLVLGGTAVMQPMGLSRPDKTVSADTLYNVWRHFGTQITSAPPALWKRVLEIQTKRRQQTPSYNGSCVDTLKIAFVGGAETTTSFARDLSREFMLSSISNNPSLKSGSGSGLYRVYGATQVLPIATASDFDIMCGEDSNSYCARGYGVCLGSKDDGLEVSIDTAVWKTKGGRSQISSPGDIRLELGELCVTGTAVSSSMRVVGKDSFDGTPIRMFHSGDVCFLEPETRLVYFLGRMAQAVDCGEQLKLVPPVGVEMVCLETKAISRCAFVGVPNSKDKGRIMPTLVAQFDQPKEDVDMEAVALTLRRALEKSVWSAILSVGVRLVAYSKDWPVDTRHSSKTNRALLKDWAATKADSHKYHTV